MKKPSVNFLDTLPKRAEALAWSRDENNLVTIELENKGLLNRLCQLIFLKPKKSFIHLDKLGSFIWERLDGKMSTEKLAEAISESFGEEAEPTLPRLAKYLEILHSYNFIEL